MKKPVRKLVSFAMVLAMLLGIFSVVPAVAAGSDNFFSITPKLQKDVEEYIMKGTLDTDANLLYGLTPQRIYTYKNGYDGEKELMKLGTNVGTGGKNAYTYKGSNALGSQFKAVATAPLLKSFMLPGPTAPTVRLPAMRSMRPTREIPFILRKASFFPPTAIRTA